MDLNLIDKGYEVIEEMVTSYHENQAVWLARDIQHDRLVILKEYRFWGNEQAAQSEQLVKTQHNNLRRFQHPATPGCYGFLLHLEKGQEDVGSYFLVEEFKPGQSLEKGFHLTLPQVHSLILQVLDVLVYSQSLNPPCFHHTLNAGDILVHHLPDGNIQVSVLNIAHPHRELIQEIEAAEVWRYDLTRLGKIVLKLITGNVTAQVTSIENYFDEITKHFDPPFLHLIYQLSGQNSSPRFYNAAEAYNRFANISPLPPLKPLKKIPIAGLISLAAVSMLFFGTFFARTDLLHLIGFGIKQVPGMHSLVQMLYRFHIYIEHLSDVSCVPFSFGMFCNSSSGLFSAAEKLGFNAVLGFEMLLFWCGIAAIVWGIFSGALLPGIAGGIVLIGFSSLWFTHYVLLYTIKITIAIVIAVSTVWLLVYCWRMMRRPNKVSQKTTAPFSLWYTGAALVLSYQAGVAFFKLIIWFILSDRLSTISILEDLAVITAWLVLLNEPEITYQMQSERYNKAQTFVLKG
ncbi:serine/threonine protein kinase containing TPR domain (plasmid) [Kalymmatonema gypsitolerans NIES-4073]|nr:serine/threonine protein kinase containing TPR domain [Scytonema sp. NIES-4073]